jgi:hypothetical protein
LTSGCCYLPVTTDLARNPVDPLTLATAIVESTIDAASTPRISGQRPLLRICFSVGSTGADTSSVVVSLSLKRQVRSLS